MKKKFIMGIGIALATMFIFSGCGNKTSASTKKSKKDLVVYTPLEEDQVNEYLQGYKKMYPEVDVKIVRDSTGVITSKLIAEKDNPKADLVWGLAATSLLTLDNKNMLEPYAPKGVENIQDKFKDKGDTPKWVGIDVFEAGITVNKEELKRKNIPVPNSFEELTRPEYKGLITMPNPASSGTGYLTVAGMLQVFGEEKGWSYLDKLHENIANYTHSGSKPAVLSAKGEYPIGISLAYRGIKEKTKGSPVEVIFPKEGLPWDLEANALIKKSDIKSEAKEFLDWAISDDIMKVYQKNYPIVSIKGDLSLPNEYPKDALDKLVKNDFVKSAKDREGILDKWTKKYDSKSEPKK